MIGESICATFNWDGLQNISNTKLIQLKSNVGDMASPVAFISIT